MERWMGKVAIVTGASAGIGRAVAIRLATEGIKTVAIARRTHLLEELAAANKNIVPYTCDVMNTPALRACIKHVSERIGDVHILVNNAGVAHFGFMSEQDTDRWQHVLETNVHALCVCSQEVIARMRAARVRGQIININSVAGHHVPNMKTPCLGIYPASKHAVTAATEQFRQEMAHLETHIKVTSLSPGYVYTGIHQDGGDTSNANGMYPEDVADAVAFILATKPNVLVGWIYLPDVKVLVAERK